MFESTEPGVNMSTGNKRSDLTKQKILQAAEEEFAEKGLYGTRVDEIASRAGVNKRMMYVYFGNKDDLYSIILSKVYSALSRYLQTVEGITSVEEFVLKYFKFLSDNPSFVKLALWENMNDSKYFKSSGAVQEAQKFLNFFSGILSMKIDDGMLSPDTDCKRLAATINAMCLSIYSDMYNMSCLLGCDLTTEAELKKQAEYICRIVTAYVK